MFCSKCGQENNVFAKFCVNCGDHTVGLASGDAISKKLDKPMNFGNSIASCLGKYFDFFGRASRPEFWWFNLFLLIISWGSWLFDTDLQETVIALINFFTFIPWMAVGVRRLHDTNRSGWWLLLMLTGVGIVPLIIWWASDECTRVDNKYGGKINF